MAAKTPLAPSGEDFHRKWLNELNDARAREKDYRREAAECVRIYEASEKTQTAFAILYSNTETLAPAIYNAVPIPLVKRRYDDQDPVGRVAAEICTRVLKYMLDIETDEYDNFDELLQSASLDALVVNRGVTRLKYVADTSGGRVNGECVYGEAVGWDKILHGFARTWKKVPWLSIQHDMTKEELQENFPQIAGQIPAESLEAWVSSEKDPATGQVQKDQVKGVMTIPVYEVWDKLSKTVFFITPVWSKGPLKEPTKAPINFRGFFPVPRPINFTKKVSTLVPTPLYTQYKQQAKELNDLTTRLRNLIRALKVRGFYNSTIEGIERVLEAEDNTIIPAENMASLPDGTGADKILWLMPLGELAGVVEKLYIQREQCKQVIYEITGVSDILRGASRASESATAQNIKREFGGMRLTRMQKEVQRYCRDLLRMMIEVATEHFSEETFSTMSGVALPTPEQKAQASLLQQQAQLAQQSGQQVPPLPAEVQNILSLPTWQEVLQLLRDKLASSYRVDIETNSTLDAEAAGDKKDIAELLGALSQFMNGVAPLIKEGVLPFEVAKEMLLAITRRYTFGSQLEDALDKMTAPPPPAQPDPADQMKLEQLKLKGQTDQQKAQLDLQVAQSEVEMKRQLAQMELEVAKAELELKRQELVLRQQELALKAEAAQVQHKLKVEGMHATAAANREKLAISREQQKDKANAAV